jgi:OFA family oxalate/formate antiporter-like MFS transporter
MGLVIDTPESVGQTPRRVSTAEPVVSTAAPNKTSREILTDRRFWLLTLSIGISSAAGITFTSHGPAMATARGVGLTMASTVLSATGAGALVGAIGFGWLIDRIGPFRALIVDLIFTAAMWLVFSQLPSLPLMIALGFFMGAGMGPAVTLHSACINEIFGPANFGRVMGYSYFIKIPFLVGPAPLVGRLYDVSAGYASTYVLVVGALAVAVLSATVLNFTRPVLLYSYPFQSSVASCSVLL